MISVSKMSATSASSRTLVLKHSVKFSWTIENYMDCPHDVGESLKSPVFRPSSLPDAAWRLVMYPSGEERGCNDIIFYLEKCSDEKFRVKCVMYFDFNGAKNQMMNFTEVMVKSEVFAGRLNKNTLYLCWKRGSENNITIHCYLAVMKMNEVVTYPIDYYHSDTKIVENPVREVTLGIELKEFYEKNRFSDFILKVGAEEFYVHKFMLAARSKVFNAMFEHDTKEQKEGRAVIHDVHPNAVRCMLEYIYSDHVNISSVTMALCLYAAAHKYDIFSLKEKCLKCLFYNLNSSNAVDIYLLAEMYNERELERLSKNYIYSNTAAILESPSWKKLAKIRPDKAADVLNGKVQ